MKRSYGYEIKELKKWIILRAMRELAEATDEFTQYDLHLVLSDMLGRELTPGEKERATKYARKRATLKEVLQDPATKSKVYIFIF